MGWSANEGNFQDIQRPWPHRRNDKSECQECTCKINKSLNRKMYSKFDSRRILVAGNQCDNSDFDFHNAEHKELPVIKISSDEGREDCQQLKPKGTQASLGTTVIAVTILFDKQSDWFLYCALYVYCDAVHV